MSWVFLLVDYVRETESGCRETAAESGQGAERERERDMWRVRYATTTLGARK